MEETEIKINNGFFFRMGFPRKLIWQDVLVIEGKNKEGRRLFETRGLSHLRYGDEFVHKDWPNYVAFVCQVPKKQLKTFMQVMYELTLNMPVFGYLDYDAACEAIIDTSYGTDRSALVRFTAK